MKTGARRQAPPKATPKHQRWFHRPEMQARVAKAEEDFAAGRSTRTTTLEEAQAFLDSLKRPPRDG